MKQIYIFLSFFWIALSYGQWQKSIISNTNGDGAFGILEKDLNNDGILDLMGAAADANTLSYFINDGAGHFTQTIITNNFTGANSIDAADFDNDGDIDFAACGSDELAWFENNNGTFIKHSIATGLNNPIQVRVSDVGTLFNPATPDGDIDIGILRSGDNTVTLYMNDGNNSFSNLTIISINTPKYLHGGNFNSDNTEDILVSSYGNNQIVWYKIGSFGFVQGGTVVSNFNGAYGCEGGDIDLDGDDDVIATAFLDNEVAWFENTDGTGTNFTKHTIDTNLPGASYIHWLDIDSDGDKDIVATGYGTTSGSTVTGSQIVIYYNDGSQNFTKTVIDDTSMGPANFSVQDFTGDNNYDIAVAASASGEFILLSQSSGSVEETNNNLVKVYPNPASDLLNIETDLNFSQIMVFDITGRKVLTTNRKHIDLASFKTGYYLVKVLFDKHRTVTKKILIIR